MAISFPRVHKNDEHVLGRNFLEWNKNDLALYLAFDWSSRYLGSHNVQAKLRSKNTRNDGGVLKGRQSNRYLLRSKLGKRS